MICVNREFKKFKPLPGAPLNWIDWTFSAGNVLKWIIGSSFFMENNWTMPSWSPTTTCKIQAIDLQLIKVIWFWHSIVSSSPFKIMFDRMVQLYIHVAVLCVVWLASISCNSVMLQTPNNSRCDSVPVPFCFCSYLFLSTQTPNKDIKTTRIGHLIRYIVSYIQLFMVPCVVATAVAMDNDRWFNKITLNNTNVLH